MRCSVYLILKTHLKQPVRLVKDERLQVLEAHRVRVAQVVDDPPLQTVAGSAAERRAFHTYSI